MRVVVLTTSWPRSEREFAGRFVADAVERLRGRGLEIEVVAPGRYRDFGLAYGGGMAANLRRRPWAAPLMLVSMLRAVRRAARSADLVHAHWLLTAAVARFAGKPFVVTLHGSGSAGRFSDVELARRWPRLVRFLLRPARAVICVSETVAAAVRRAGVEGVYVIPNGVRVPESVAPPAAPPQVLYVGRLSPEKNIDTLVEACGDLNLVVAGDGPLRRLVPGALGAVPHAEVERLLERASVVVAPCEREGFGLAAAEAMAFGRPVVAAAGGALLELVADGETGLLVPPRDAAALRAAVERLLADPELRVRLGSAARERARERFGWEAVIERTLAVYRRALEPRASTPSG
ncbi:MAG: glycosyltransferase family 4 protein [Thermoleophilia bacterium]|nr:glycosyltransferase family 4 protein [Thermoleophilia bacterium]